MESATLHQPRTGVSTQRLDGREILAGLGLPCALFAMDSNRMLLCNDAFAAEFRLAATVSDADEFMQRFELLAGNGASLRAPVTQARETQEVYARTTGRSYAFTWHPLPAARVRLLSALNLTTLYDALHRHGALQEQLLSTSRALSVGEVVNTLAHELNQPLAAALNYLTAAGAGPDRNDRASQAVRKAGTQIEHAVAVIDRIREFVRAREPRREPHDLRTLMQRVVELMQPQAQKYRVRVRLPVAGDLPQVLADAVMIEQVLANLVNNAIEAMQNTAPARREVAIGARLDASGRVQVRVSDQGPGISPDEAQRLFQPLYTTKARGMGLGLALCRSIVEFHDGSLYLDPDRDGGATFVFTLPCTRSEGGS